MLDDVYIHLSLAKNYVENGAWSINSTGFDSASSSILYTLLLSFCIKLFGNWEYYPLVINICFGYFTLYAFYRYFKDFYGAAEFKWALFLLLPFTMLHFTVLIGMEHTIHMFLMVLAVYFIHKNVEINFSSRFEFVKLLIIVFFLATIRFESMFFTSALAVALFLRKNIYQGIWVLIIGVFPILIFGLFSIKNGGYFFPNSVMIKGSFPSGNHFISNMWKIFEVGILFNPSFYKCLFFPFVLIIAHLAKKYRKFDFRNTFFKKETLIIAMVITGILHALFSVLKYRYENYLMIAFLMVIAPIIADFFKNFKREKLNFGSVLNLFSIFMIGVFSIYRFGSVHYPLVYSSKGINEQQIEMSRFLGMFYKNEKVVANDIGAIAYFSNVQLLDIVGLGSTDVAKNIIENKHETEDHLLETQNRFLSNYILKNNYKVAVIYPGWFPGKLPAKWFPVASWTISENSFGPARKTVVFYALSKEEILPLKKNLQKFNLNKNIGESYYPIQIYTGKK